MAFAARAHDAQLGAQQELTPPPQGNELARGEIQSVERESAAITIKHEPLPQLGMPSSMIMQFHVSHPAMLESLEPGDRIGFSAEGGVGHFTVTEIRPVGAPR